MKRWKTGVCLLIGSGARNEEKIMISEETGDKSLPQYVSATCILSREEKHCCSLKILMEKLEQYATEIVGYYQIYEDFHLRVYIKLSFIWVQ